MAVNKLWNEFDRLVLAPAGVKPGSTQWVETRRTFYGAIQRFMAEMVEAAGDGSTDDSAGLAYLESARRDLNHFYDELKAGRA
jgi:hypothetical protein